MFTTFDNELEKLFTMILTIDESGLTPQEKITIRNGFKDTFASSIQEQTLNLDKEIKSEELTKESIEKTKYSIKVLKQETEDFLNEIKEDLDENSLRYELLSIFFNELIKGLDDYLNKELTDDMLFVELCRENAKMPQCAHDTDAAYDLYAPETVTNFIKLANNGFYDGLTFHRVVKDFMIQGGDPNGDGTGNATLRDLGEDSDDEYTIPGEFIANGYNENTLKHEKGIISMARGDYSSESTTLLSEGYNSASCQFFITTTDQSMNLDGLYAAFGKVIEGMDVVDKISEVEIQTSNDEESSTTSTDTPVNPPVITSIRVDTFGIDYGIPETREPFDINSWYMSQQYGY